MRSDAESGRGAYLTQASVRALPAPPMRRSIKDGVERLASASALYFDSEIPGFHVVVSSKGVKTFRVRYRKMVDGRQQWFVVMLGRWRDGRERVDAPRIVTHERDRGAASKKATLSANEARVMASEVRAKLNQGDNPALAAKLRAATQQAQAEKTLRVATAFQEYVHYVATRAKPMSPGSLANMKSAFEQHILPALGKTFINAVSPAAIERLAQEVAQAREVDGRKVGGQSAARHMVAQLSAFLTWCMRRGYAAANAAKQISRGDVLTPANRRERYLTEDEWRTLWEALDDWPYNAKRGGRYVETKEVRLDKPQLRQLLSCEVLRLCLLTGARKGEVMRMRWEHVDLDRAWWTKPAATTKTRKKHEVPLSALAVESLRKVRAAHADPEWVFPGKSRAEALARGKMPKGGSHVQDVHELWGRICQTIGLKGATIHDLRHTAASVLISNGADLYAVGAQLGHASPQTTARYAHLFEASKRQTVALQDAYAQKILNTPPAGSR